jgi:hypothetical protein
MQQEETMAELRRQRELHQRVNNAIQAEPYMLSGYESLARRDYDAQARQMEQEKEKFQPLGSAVGNHFSSSTNPVYRGPASHILQGEGSMAQESNRTPSMTEAEWQDLMRKQAMENQYGQLQIFQQSRGTGFSSEDMDML